MRDCLDFIGSNGINSWNYHYDAPSDDIEYDYRPSRYKQEFHIPLSGPNYGVIQFSLKTVNK